MARSPNLFSQNRLGELACGRFDPSKAQFNRHYFRRICFPRGQRLRYQAGFVSRQHMGQQCFEIAHVARRVEQCEDSGGDQTRQRLGFIGQADGQGDVALGVFSSQVWQAAGADEACAHARCKGFAWHCQHRNASP